MTAQRAECPHCKVLLSIGNHAADCPDYVPLKPVPYDASGFVRCPHGLINASACVHCRKETK